MKNFSGGFLFLEGGWGCVGFVFVGGRPGEEGRL